MNIINSVSCNLNVLPFVLPEAQILPPLQPDKYAYYYKNNNDKLGIVLNYQEA